MPSYLETGGNRGCIHSRSNPASDMLMNLLKTIQLCAISTLTSTANYQQDISLERQTLWPITNRLYIVVLPMDVISLQKQREMECDMQIW